ncbi:MAG: leucine-rich repeat domain-containing protein, partial [Muribaculaceae bacterium]|nr:leucine-rich repeat domain-containing protein [Muribaculaceae bacterium]
CTNLSNIDVSAKNKIYDSRNNCNAIIETKSNTLIAGCKNTQMPNSITKMGDYAFANCTKLTKATIPSSVTTIGECAFKGCTGLKKVFIPNSVEVIERWSFEGCSQLTKITIPNSVKMIGDFAFQDCTNLANIVVSAKNKIYDSRNNCNAIIETKSNTLIVGCKNTSLPKSVKIKQ